MDRNTLIAALVGALIATIPILISNLVQIYLHLSERKQKEKEAKVQAKEKWVERDIMTIMDSMEEILKLLSNIYEIVFQTDFRLLRKGGEESSLAPKDYASEIKFIYSENLPKLRNEIDQKIDAITRLSNSFDEAIMTSSCSDFVNAINNQLYDADLQVENRLSGKGGIPSVDYHVNLPKVNETAGKFHKVLREKLISIRDS